MKAETRKKWELANAIESCGDSTPTGRCPLSSDPDLRGAYYDCEANHLHDDLASMQLDGLDISELP